MINISKVIKIDLCDGEGVADLANSVYLLHLKMDNELEVIKVVKK